jgi:hypothetical protein
MVFGLTRLYYFHGLPAGKMVMDIFSGLLLAGAGYLFYQSQKPSEPSGPIPSNYPVADSSVPVLQVPMTISNPYGEIVTPAVLGPVTVNSQPTIALDTLHFAEPVLPGIKTDPSEFTIPSDLTPTDAAELERYLASWIGAGLTKAEVQQRMDNFVFGIRQRQAQLAAILAGETPVSPVASMSVLEMAQARLMPVAIASNGYGGPGRTPISPEEANRYLYYGDAVPANTTNISWMDPVSGEWNQGRQLRSTIDLSPMSNLTAADVAQLRYWGINI